MCVAFFVLCILSSPRTYFVVDHLFQHRYVDNLCHGHTARFHICLHLLDLILIDHLLILFYSSCRSEWLLGERCYFPLVAVKPLS